MSAPIMIVVITRMSPWRAMNDEFVSQWLVDGKELNAKAKFYSPEMLKVPTTGLLLIHGDVGMMDPKGNIPDLVDVVDKAIGSIDLTTWTALKPNIWLFVHGTKGDSSTSYDESDIIHEGEAVSKKQFNLVTSYSSLAGSSASHALLETLKNLKSLKRERTALLTGEDLQALHQAIETNCINPKTFQVGVLLSIRELLAAMWFDAEAASYAQDLELRKAARKGLLDSYNALCEEIRHPLLLKLQPAGNTDGRRLYVVAGDPHSEVSAFWEFERSFKPPFSCEEFWKALGCGQEDPNVFETCEFEGKRLFEDFCCLSRGVDELIKKAQIEKAKQAPK